MGSVEERFRPNSYERRNKGAVMVRGLQIIKALIKS